MMQDKQSPVLNCREILKATGGSLSTGKGEGMFYGISTDSRQISEGNLFIALKGEIFDGHDFLAEVVKGGACGLVIREGSRDKLNDREAGKATVILVQDTLQALGDIANFWRKKFTIPLVAITGSAGKTTTKEMVAGIVGLAKKVIKNEGNYNNLIGLPLTIFRINEHHDIAILEMGTNSMGEIGRLTRIAEPDYGLITNIGPAHLEGLKSIENIRQEKGDLFRNMAKTGVALINLDDMNSRILSKIWVGKKITFGLRPEADVAAENIKKMGNQGISFNLRIGRVCKEVELSITGDHNISNALAAAASSWALGIDQDLICRGLTAFKPLSGRMEICRLKNGSFLINDSYNSNPLSVREALKTLGYLKGNHEGIVILGDMLELGDQADEMHEGIGSVIAENDVATLFLKGNYSRRVAEGALKGGISEKQIYFVNKADDFVPYLKLHLHEGDWVLVKGSRKMKMEEIVRKIIEVFGIEI